ncbi:MAG: nitroreductase family protein [Treponema sp.]|jgi:nitroreductase|nr:nitroreductase family protein [Treponema sp.]
MKKMVFFGVFLALLVFVLGAQENKGGINAIIHHYAARNFASGPVSRADLDQILQAGIRSPSANNRQPWMFTVVQSPALARQIVSNNEDGNVLIVISAEGDGRTNGRQILDCALAAQSMYLAAQALGYGSRIYTGPVDSINQNLKTQLALPRGHSAVVLVRVGRVQGNVDALSAASSRAAADTKVQYK